MTPGRSDNMAKKEGHAYHKPKPRVAVYAGIAGSALVELGVVHGVVPYDTSVAGKGQHIPQLAANLGATLSDWGAAVEVATPAAIGLVVSVGADKLGVNKVLAKMKAPFRV